MVEEAEEEAGGAVVDLEEGRTSSRPLAITTLATAEEEESRPWAWSSTMAVVAAEGHPRRGVEIVRMADETTEEVAEDEGGAGVGVHLDETRGTAGSGMIGEIVRGRGRGTAEEATGTGTVTATGRETETGDDDVLHDATTLTIWTQNQHASTKAKKRRPLRLGPGLGRPSPGVDQVSRT